LKSDLLRTAHVLEDALHGDDVRLHFVELADEEAEHQRDLDIDNKNKRYFSLIKIAFS
jgi:hypothetical protein